MPSIVDKAKAAFFKAVDDFGSDPYAQRPHVPEVERWARYLLKQHSEADGEVVLLAVWLHDIGHYPVPTDIDHAVRSEERAKAFLTKEKCAKGTMEKVLHCVRAHRCKDVMPETIEAKIVACADSASHMTQQMYFAISIDDKEAKRPFRAYAKMDRDFRDLAAFPALQKELEQLYEAWKKLIKAYEKIDTD